MKPIAFVDLKRNYESVREEITRSIQSVLDSTSFILGKDVKQFEEEYASYCNARFCVGVASGLDALKLSLKALGIGPGDEVITAANTFIATVLAISDSGAKPVLVDCDPEYHTIDPRLVERAITGKTKAIIPVHLYGQVADMEALGSIAEAHGLRIVEDACQAHGAHYGDRRAGTLGDAGCFSYYPGKNLGAFGDAGAMVTNNEDLAARIRLLRDYGQREKYHHESQGVNSRLDTIQAAVLRVKLRYLDQWNEQRRKVADSYGNYLADADGITLPSERVRASHVYHLYVVRVANRDRVLEKMKTQGISCGIHYPIPIHRQKAYADLGYAKGSFPVTEAYAGEVLSLPMFPELTEEEVVYISDSLKQAVRGS